MFTAACLIFCAFSVLTVPFTDLETQFAEHLNCFASCNPSPFLIFTFANFIYSKFVYICCVVLFLNHDANIQYFCIQITEKRNYFNKMYKDTINQRFIFSVDYIISEKIAPTKASIAQNLDIKTSKFSEILNKRMSVSAELLSNFSRKYGISVEWLITGEGDMLKSTPDFSQSTPKITQPVPSPKQPDQSPGDGCPFCKEKDERIKDLQKSIEMWETNFKSLSTSFQSVMNTQQDVIHSLQDQIDDLQQQHFDDEEDVTSQAG